MFIVFFLIVKRILGRHVVTLTKHTTHLPYLCIVLVFLLGVVKRNNELIFFFSYSNLFSKKKKLSNRHDFFKNINLQNKYPLSLKTIKNNSHKYQFHLGNGILYPTDPHSNAAKIYGKSELTPLIRSGIIWEIWGTGSICRGLVPTNSGIMLNLQHCSGDTVRESLKKVIVRSKDMKWGYLFW